MNGKPIPRNKDGLIERACLSCGKIRYSNHGWPKDRCRHCAKVYRFKHNPAVGLKAIKNMDKLVTEYKSGESLMSLGKQYSVSATTIRSKLVAYGCRMRPSYEISVKQKTYLKAHGKVRQLCKTGKFQKNMSARLQGIPVEEWKGFITPENKRLVASPEYRQWQKTIFNRDGRTCQLCGKTKCPIAAHHIYPKAKYLGKVLDVDNGITLCNECHYKTIGREEEFIDHFVNLLTGDLCGKKL